MPQFAANLSWMYTELAFSDRFEAAARDGFKAVELLSPYSWPTAGLRTRPERERPATGAVQRAARRRGCRQY